MAAQGLDRQLPRDVGAKGACGRGCTASGEPPCCGHYGASEPRGYDPAPGGTDSAPATRVARALVPPGSSHGGAGEPRGNNLAAEDADSALAAQVAQSHVERKRGVRRGESGSPRGGGVGTGAAAGHLEPCPLCGDKIAKQEREIGALRAALNAAERWRCGSDVAVSGHGCGKRCCEQQREKEKKMRATTMIRIVNVTEKKANGK